jgi:hypothetical protein
MKLGVLMMAASLVVGCAQVPQTGTARVSLAQSEPEYKEGERIAYSGVAKSSNLGGYYVENLTARPSAVHLSDGRKFQEDLRGKRVTATGVLLSKMIGSDDGKTQAIRQRIFYMEQYELDVAR